MGIRLLVVSRVSKKFCHHGNLRWWLSSLKLHSHNWNLLVNRIVSVQTLCYGGAVSLPSKLQRLIPWVNVLSGNDRYLSFKPSSSIAFSPCFQQRAQLFLCTCVFLIEMQNCHIYNDTHRLDHSQNNTYQNHIEVESENIGVLFYCLHVHSIYPVCATWKEKMGHVV